MGVPQKSNLEEFYRGWPTLLAAIIGVAFGLAAVPIYTFGVFVPELHKEFDWGSGFVLSGFLIAAICQVCLSPVVGWLADRFGVRRIVLICVPGFALAYAAFALGNGSPWLYMATWILLSVFGTGTSHMIWTRGVNGWFERYKGAALGIALAGTGIFGSLIKPILHNLITAYGWRASFVLVAAAPFFVAWPLAWLAFRERPVARETLDHLGLSLKDALQTRQFWIMALVFVPLAGCIAAPVLNLESILRTANFGPGDIVALTSAFGVSVTIGRLVGGWLLDRIWAPLVAFVGLSLPSLSFLVLAHGPGLQFEVAIVALIVFAFAGGLEFDCLAFFCARYFGLKNYSTIYGLLYALITVGVGGAPPLFGYIFDKTGSFSMPLHVAAIVLPLCAASFLFMGRYRFKHQEAKNETAEIISSAGKATSTEVTLA
jgi:MFS family permease